ncbi:DUF6682 family protein [Marinobacter sp.]|uniref:phage adaptor protein n=1 Tax=Marinobacter sp. TaxID=50741 RepID=UPI003A91D2CE
MTTAGDIINRAATTLFDDTKLRWSETELLQCLSDAQREAVLLNPSAYTKNAAVQLVPGTVQSLPEEGLALVSLGGNLGADGNTPGRSVTQVGRTDLDASRPNWRAMPATGTAQHFLYDDRDPLRFEVYPPQPDPAHYVRLVYAAEPPAITDPGDPVALASMYDTALYYLVLARAFSKSSGTQDFTKAAGYQQIAHRLITGRKVTKQELHPTQLQERTKR